jgi:hypothetical protein
MKDSHTDIRGAVVDLLYLLEKGYPKKSALELVGNRHRLSGDGRMILYRGVFTRGECEGRIRKMADLKTSPSDTCVIDGYNVFITIESYLRGRLIFRALDGLIRDISGVYGNYTFGRRTEQAMALLIPCLQGALSKVGRFFIYLDEPVSRSGEFARFLRSACSAAGIPAMVEVVRSPDEVIAERHGRDLVATSDTVLLDRVEHCTDIPDAVLDRGTLFDLQVLLRGELTWLGLT